MKIEDVASAEAGPSPSHGLATIEEIIEEARAGRMFLLVDDEDRENEGDLVIPAQFAGPAQVNFMARHGRGLICLALEAARAEYMGLRPMTQSNSSRHSTAFTVSIEAREGIDTGISAHDRARTIAVAIDPDSTSYDLVSPGHVFPLIARDGGTLVRAGHTEAAVDVARLAGLNPSGVICEVMNDDGTMARLPQLMAFARAHDLKIATIADLIAYRRQRERLVERVRSGPVTDGLGREWTLSVFRDSITGTEHAALTIGDLTTPEPVLVRIQVDDSIEQLLLSRRAHALPKAMDRVTAAGRGAIILVRGTRPLVFTAEARISGSQLPLLKDFGIGAQIMIELGIRNIDLLVNTKKTIVALEGFGLRVENHIVVE